MIIFPMYVFSGNDAGESETPAFTNMCLYLKLIRQIKKEMSQKYVWLQGAATGYESGWCEWIALIGKFNFFTGNFVNKMKCCDYERANRRFASHPAVGGNFDISQERRHYDDWGVHDYWHSWEVDELGNEIKRVGYEMLSKKLFKEIWSAEFLNCT